MTESHPSQSIRPDKLIHKGARLAVTGLSVFILTASLLANGMSVSAQTPALSTATPAAGTSSAHRDNDGRLSKEGLAPATGSKTTSPSSPDGVNTFYDSGTKLVSINSEGTSTGDDDSNNKAISEDGTLVVYDSWATDLAINFSNQKHRQIYLQTIIPNETHVSIPVSVSADDATKGGDGDGRFPTISGDGKIVAWMSFADNLVDGFDLSARTSQVYVRDLTKNTTTLVTQTATGEPANNTEKSWSELFTPANPPTKYPGYWYTPLALSTSGNVLVYQSTATNLVSAANNGISQIFAYNTVNQAITLVSKSSPGGNPADCNAEHPRVSGDGRFVVFDSCAQNLVGFSKPNIYQVFMVDLNSGAISVVSKIKDTTTGLGNDLSLYPEISKDGSTVTFRSSANNILSTDDFQYSTGPNIYLAKIRSNSIDVDSIKLISHTKVHANAESNFSTVSSDGRYIAFSSNASNLIPNDTNENCYSDSGQPAFCPDIYLYDAINGTVEKVSISADNTNQSNSLSYLPSISGNGRYVAFDSYATNLLTGTGITVAGPDLDNIYMRDRGTELVPVPRMSIDPMFLSFGDQGTGGSQTLNLKVISSGGADLKVNPATLLDDGSGVFVITGQTCDSAKALTHGDFCTVTITYTQPSRLGVWTGKLQVTSNDASSPSFIVQLAGGSGGVISVDQKQLAFGNVALNTTKTLFLTVTSAGTGSLTVDPGSLTDDSNGSFHIDSQNCNSGTPLIAGQTCGITVSFTPKTVQTIWTGNLRITSTDPNNSPLDVPLTGGASVIVLDANPNPLVFSHLDAAGQSSTIDLKITSLGTTDLIIGTVNLVGSGTPFVVTADTCTGITLKTGDPACTISVKFTQAYSWGTYHNTLRITSNDSARPTLDIPVKGGSGTLVWLPKLNK